jgi:hypothetical protein
VTALRVFANLVSTRQEQSQKISWYQEHSRYLHIAESENENGRTVQCYSLQEVVWSPTLAQDVSFRRYKL